MIDFALCSSMFWSYEVLAFAWFRRLGSARCVREGLRSQVEAIDRRSSPKVCALRSMERCQLSSQASLRRRANKSSMKIGAIVRSYLSTLRVVKIMARLFLSFHADAA